MSLIIDSRQKGVTQTIDLAIDAEVQSVYLEVNTDTEWQVVCDLAAKRGQEVRRPDRWSHRENVDLTIAGVMVSFKGPRQPDEHFDDDGVYVGPNLPVLDEEGQPVTS